MYDLSLLLDYQNDLERQERQELIAFITSWTNRYGTDAHVEFWAAVRWLFLAKNWNDDATWQQEAAKILGISYPAFRRRKREFKRSIAVVLMNDGYARQEPARHMRLAA